VTVEFTACEEASAARLLNQPFRKHARTGLPLVTLKLAISLDGHTATPAGDSPWISGERSRELVHRWRAESDAIAVGIGTVLADDPLLTARIHNARRPIRIVFDRRARLPLDSQLLRTLDQAPVLAVVAPETDASALRRAGAEILVADGIEPVLAELGRRGITSLFLEGGLMLAAAFQVADELDEARTFVAPILLGGRQAATHAGGADVGGPRTDALRPPAGPPTVATGPARLVPLSHTVEPVGDDVLITARFREW
jgi:diaminohydroxyphosphoribosylaminopyrimidine deaminase/5-amino-6-(5-phosphoribosylamino)uracil reductase